MPSRVGLVSICRENSTIRISPEPIRYRPNHVPMIGAPRRFVKTVCRTGRVAAAGDRLSLVHGRSIDDGARITNPEVKLFVTALAPRRHGRAAHGPAGRCERRHECERFAFKPCPSIGGPPFGRVGANSLRARNTLAPPVFCRGFYICGRIIHVIIRPQATAFAYELAIPGFSYILRGTTREAKRGLL